MLKFEIVKCTKPFNNEFKLNELYKSYPNKRGQIQVFVDDERHLIVPKNCLVISDQPYYLNFFEPVANILLPDIKVCKEMQLKSVAEILKLIEII